MIRIHSLTVFEILVYLPSPHTPACLHERLSPIENVNSVKNFSTIHIPSIHSAVKRIVILWTGTDSHSSGGQICNVFSFTTMICCGIFLLFIVLFLLLQGWLNRLFFNVSPPLSLMTNWPSSSNGGEFTHNHCLLRDAILGSSWKEQEIFFTTSTFSIIRIRIFSQ